MMVICEVGKVFNNYCLIDCILYVIFELCLMCVGLLVYSCIKWFVYGVKDVKMGFVGFIMNLL